MLKLSLVLTLAFVAATSSARISQKGNNDPGSPRHLTSNAAYYLESYDKKEFAFGFDYNGIYVYLTWKRRRFTIQTPGVNRQLGTISLKSTDRKDFYATYVEGHGILLQSRTSSNKTIDEWENDATFVVRDNLFHPGYAAFESYSHESYFIGHRDCQAHSNCLDLFGYYDNLNDTTFGDRVSFRRKEGPYVVESYDYQRIFVGVTGQYIINLNTDPHYWYLVHPSLEGDDGSISLESAINVNHYMQYNRSNVMRLEECSGDECHPEGPRAEASSFKIEKDKYFEGFFALKVDDGEYVRHSNHSMIVDGIDSSDTSAKMAASWRAMRGPYYVEPSTYAGTAITVKAGQREAYLDRDSTRLVFVYPGLTGEGGTVSLQIADRDYIDHYLKFDKDTEQLIFATVDRSDPFDPEDASFWLHADLFAVNTVSFESFRREGHYLVPYGKLLKVTDDFDPTSNVAAFFIHDVY